MSQIPYSLKITTHKASIWGQNPLILNGVAAQLKPPLQQPCRVSYQKSITTNLSEWRKEKLNSCSHNFMRPPLDEKHKSSRPLHETKFFVRFDIPDLFYIFSQILCNVHAKETKTSYTFNTFIIQLGNLIN